jgi:hypothetical protein
VGNKLAHTDHLEAMVGIGCQKRVVCNPVEDWHFVRSELLMKQGVLLQQEFMGSNKNYFILLIYLQ